MQRNMKIIIIIFFVFNPVTVDFFDIPKRFVGVIINVIVVGHMIGIHLIHAMLWNNYTKALKISCCLCWIATTKYLPQCNQQQNYEEWGQS